MNVILSSIRISLQTRIGELEKNLAVEQEAKEKVKIINNIDITWKIQINGHCSSKISKFRFPFFNVI